MSDVFGDIKRGKLAPIYFVCGEAFERDRLVSAIRAHVFKDNLKDFNYDAFSGAQADAQSIINAAKTLPMMGTMRLVEIRAADEMPGEALTKLIPYVESPSPSTCLLFVAQSADARLKFFSVLKKNGVFCRFEPLKDRQVSAWITQEARHQAVILGAGAAERIAEAIGTDMAQLAGAIEQLGLYVGEGKPVTAESVETLLAQTRQRSIFELTNAFGKGDRREALAVLGKMLAAGESSIMVVTMIARHLRHLWQAKELDEQALTSKDIAAQIGVHPFFVGDVIAQQKRFSVDQLKTMHRLLVDADKTLKSSPIADAQVMNQLVFKLCS